ncbi:MAG: alpha/beta hydrolase, partial [Syntrophomonadaceae bacterium]
VLETPFLSARSLAREHYPWIPLVLVRNRYDNEARVAGIPVPKLFIVAENDEVAPAAQGRRLFETARGARELVVVPGAHHNDVWIVGGDAYWKAWANFLSSLSPRETGVRGKQPPPSLPPSPPGRGPG